MRIDADSGIRMLVCAAWTHLCSCSAVHPAQAAASFVPPPVVPPAAPAAAAAAVALPTMGILRTEERAQIRKARVSAAG